MLTWPTLGDGQVWSVSQQWYHVDHTVITGQGTEVETQSHSILISPTWKHEYDTERADWGALLWLFQWFLMTPRRHASSSSHHSRPDHLHLNHCQHHHHHYLFVSFYPKYNCLHLMTPNLHYTVTQDWDIVACLLSFHCWVWTIRVKQ